MSLPQYHRGVADTDQDGLPDDLDPFPDDATNNTFYFPGGGYYTGDTFNPINRPGGGEESLPPKNGWGGGHDYGPVPAGTDALMRKPNLKKENGSATRTGRLPLRSCSFERVAISKP